ncbi:MAG: TlpA family protein disulfide reductase [Winogradskyella sp.]|nr:TlpA disulfide reductase family protein [Winogradskyella sp.]MBT8245881.1 TlpA family protein disulfide reductase [Winogradskyella sp.]NNK23048.1 TlpA family protein disulfide reductase [Winogradskyella sp.]
MRYLSLLLMALSLLSCKKEDTSKTLKKGTYRMVLEVQDTQELPFIFEVTSDSTLTIFNADERIEVNEIRYVNDSIYIKTPVFQSYFAGVFEGNNIKGEYINKTRNRIVPFFATYDTDVRFYPRTDSAFDISGVWEVVFSKDTKGEYIAKGVFEQDGQYATGTFRTTTGDYRYLEGVMDGSTLKLSTYDGAHAFLFKADVSKDEMSGQFYSGNHWKEPFAAKRNPDYTLPKIDELTYLNEGYEALEFSFPDEKGNMVSLSDERFKDKVVLVQIMGTWCPNCLDSSKFYTQFHDENKDKGFEVVALTVEFKKTPEAAFENINRLRARVGMTYPILLAQYGSGSKSKLQEKLPALNHVLSYPTSIFIDKTGKVRKIHTGFNGPATGKKYTEFKTEFEGFIAELLAE